MKPPTELESLIQRFEYVAKEICQVETTIKFQSRDEHDEKISNLEGRQKHYTIADDHVTAVGWPAAEWIRLLKSQQPDLLPSNGSYDEWEASSAWEVMFQLVDKIVAECYAIFPHVDTTVFAEFGQSFSMLHLCEDVAILGGTGFVADKNDVQFLNSEHTYWCDWPDNDELCHKEKLRLRQIFERAVPACRRIRILNSTAARAAGRQAQTVEHDFEYRECDYLDITIGLRTIRRPNSREVELTRAQWKLVYSLIYAGDSGVNFHDLIPKVASNDERLRDYLKLARRRLKKIDLTIQCKNGGVWTLVEMTPCK